MSAVDISERMRGMIGGKPPWLVLSFRFETLWSPPMSRVCLYHHTLCYYGTLHTPRGQHRYLALLPALPNLRFGQLKHMMTKTPWKIW